MSRPPIATVLASVGAAVGALPFAVFALFGAPFLLFVLVGILQMPWTWDGDPDDVREAAVLLQGGLLVVGFPVLLVTAVVRLLARRDRLMLLACVPVTPAMIGLVVLAEGWNLGLLVFVFPLAASLTVLWPSVGGWVAVPAAA
jgi:hypothetical protein